MTKLLTTAIRKVKLIIIVKFVVYFLSFELGGKILGVTEQLGEYISSKEIVFPLTSKDVKPKKTWIEILNEAKRKGKSIKPVKHRKHLIPENIFCPNCGAPAKFIYFYVIVNGLQKYQCKLCSR